MLKGGFSSAPTRKLVSMNDNDKINDNCLILLGKAFCMLENFAYFLSSAVL